MDLRKFVLFADARTGGTHFIDMLNSHPHIYCVGEPFAHLNLRTHQDQKNWMKKKFLLKKVRNKEVNVRGFRTKIEQIANPVGFNDLLISENYTCFALIRRNIVKKAVSRIRAKKLFQVTGDYNLRNRDKKLSPIKITFDKLIREIRICEIKNRQVESYLSSLPLKLNILYYNNMLKDENQFFNHTLKILNTELKPLTTRTYKNTSDKLRESIINFDQLDSELKSTQYHDMLHKTI